MPPETPRSTSEKQIRCADAQWTSLDVVTRRASAELLESNTGEEHICPDRLVMFYGASMFG